MKLEIDQNKLLKQLAKAPACNPIQASGYAGEINTYLIERFLQPMHEDRLPTIGELDFSAFDLDELDEFGDYIKNSSQMSSRIDSWCNTFRAAEPIAQKQRAFC